MRPKKSIGRKVSLAIQPPAPSAALFSEGRDSESAHTSRENKKKRMKTPIKNSELHNRIAHHQDRGEEEASNSPKKWIIYTFGNAPLVGFVHANSKAEALDRVAGFKLQVIAVQADEKEIDPMTPEAIAKQFALVGSVIPSATDDPGRRRTAYFFRKQAIEWARSARQSWSSFPGLKLTSVRLAKRYLIQYRLIKNTL